MKTLLFFLLLTTSAMAAEVGLIWDAPDAATPIGYRVYWGLASGNYSDHQDFGTDLTATVGNLEMGKTYYFAATALYPGGIESGFSNEAVKEIPWAPAPGNVRVESVKINLEINLPQ